MKESIRPGDLVLVDQFIDRTRQRASTFFEDIGVVAHVSPTGGGVFTAHVGLRFRYSARTGGWRPAVLMMLDDAELPDGSRPPTLVGPRVLRVFAELQAPANRAGVDRMTINDL